ncbi:MAG: D-cysteine desulfhydrase family protein [Fusobacteriaceae bacterium]|jgi:D-cysteine desulfhydrase|nr:D-cysteine desulfhydrase family protein [Fusobacteriaceae bacterium]
MKEKLNIANFPTKIERLENFSKEVGKNVFLKRDDQTGSEFSGNKIRKLEYSIKEAIDQDCDTLITCGGIQSNHARSTAAAGVKMGLKSVLVLRSDETPILEGNYFIDKLIGADVRIISSSDYRDHRKEIMENIQKELEKEGRKAYIVPEGASNGIGVLGYYTGFDEILKQEKSLGINFDTIVVAVGSGGTYAGLYLGNKINNSKKDIVGVNVCDDADFFKNKSVEIINECLPYIDNPKVEITTKDMHIIDGYVGIGYAKSRPEELDFIHKFAVANGVILDPVYTGKAMYGIYNEIKKGNLKDSKNILFIHTGGIFGLFPKSGEFQF